MEEEREQIPICPECKYKMVKVVKELKSLGGKKITVWACPTGKKPGCPT